jgi:xanthine dehydrogenase YagS FAD-binding subunit
MTVDGAVAALATGNHKAVAGGIDVLCLLKDRVQPTYPEGLVNLKSIPAMDYIKEEGGVLKIGALVLMADVAANTTVRSKYAALAQAAYSVATPQLRNAITIGGNLCQETRCWYYRAPENYFNCTRKGGKLCYAMTGENRYNSAFGHVGGCICVHPSDPARALVALDARIITNKRVIAAGDFFPGNKPSPTVLSGSEIITEIQVPEPKQGTKQVYLKFRLRKSMDFAISAVAVAITVKDGIVSDARIVLGGATPVPRRATGAEEALIGNAISEPVADAAAAAAVADAIPLSKNAYLIPITRTLVKRAILA